MMGDEYSIADIAIFPMVRNLIGFYGAGELVGFGDFPHVKRALDAVPRAARCATRDLDSLPRLNNPLDESGDMTEM